jgi:hypothetical protein
MVIYVGKFFSPMIFEGLKLTKIFEGNEHQEVALGGNLAVFRTALLNEIDAATL